MIGIEDVKLMTEEDFEKVGIYVIGIRLKIKQACQNYVKGTESSLVVQKFIDLQEPKKKNKMASARRNLVRNEKSTRRVYLGWKHSTSKDVYKVVSARDGGGQQVIDIQKDFGYEAFVKRILDIYFPNGRSEAKKLNLIEVSFFIASFSGMIVPQLEEMGGFTIGRYFTFAKSYPVRVYLHTMMKDAHTDQSSDEDLPNIFSPTQTGTASVSNPSVIASVSNPSVIASVLNPSVTASVSIPSVTNASTGTLIASCSYSAPSPNILDTGTPEVTFHPRHRLRLHCTNRFPRNLSPSRMESETINIVDSEDEEIQQAIHASLQDNTAPCEESSIVRSATTVQEEFQRETVLLDASTKIIVFRAKLLESAIKALNRKSINLNARLYVKFSGEIGEDYGGPRREFFRLAIHALHNSPYFEGPEGDKIFCHDIDILEKGNFRIIGRLVSLSLIQEGPGMRFLNQKFFDLMVGGSNPELNDIEMFLPEGLKTIISQLQDADCIEERERFLLEHGDWLFDQGFNNPYKMTLDNKEELINKLKKQYFYYRLSGEISQFVDGMNEVGCSWNFVKKNAELLKPLFCHIQKLLSINDMMELFHVSYSEQGSNNKSFEDLTVYALELFLQSIDEREVPVSFADLLVLATGADNIPPCGFEKQININFYSQESGSMRLPHVSTCSLQLWLPRGATPELLSDLLVRSIKESAGFLKI